MNDSSVALQAPIQAYSSGLLTSFLQIDLLLHVWNELTLNMYRWRSYRIHPLPLHIVIQNQLGKNHLYFSNSIKAPGAHVISVTEAVGQVSTCGRALTEAA